MKQALMSSLCFTMFCSNPEGESDWDDVLKYHHYCNHAEMLLLEHDFTKASQYFDSAFILFKNPFPSHLLNSAYSYYNNGDIKKAKANLKSLIERGFEINNLRLFKWVENLLDPSLLSLAESVAIEPDNYFNSELRERIIFLDVEDQRVRHLPNAYIHYKDSVDRVDNQNIQELIKIFEEYGYLSSREIGVKALGSFVPGEIIIHHALQNKSQVFLDYLKKGLRTGKLHPFQYARLIDTYENPFTGPCRTMIFKYGDSLVNPFIESDVLRVNGRRKAIGLDELEVYHKKVDHMLKADSPNYFFHYVITEQPEVLETYIR